MNREADTDLLRDSGLIEQMHELTIDLLKKYKIYGDSVFPNIGNIVSKHIGIGITSRQQRFENAIMTMIRIANEWHMVLLKICTRY
jgi:hypothetical protein